jgi:hypothetical protein
MCPFRAKFDEHLVDVHFSSLEQRAIRVDIRIAAGSVDSTTLSHIIGRNVQESIDINVALLLFVPIWIRTG